MPNQVFIGIDPGLTGAIATLHIADGTYVSHVFDMPLLQKMKSSERPTYDPSALLQILEPLKNESLDPTVVLEQLHPQPKIGAVANFSMGYGAGLLNALINQLGFRLIQVSPAKWKKTMGLNAHKDISRQIAQELFPEHKDQLKLKKHHGRAEALLLGEYGRRIYGNGNAQ